MADSRSNYGRGSGGRGGYARARDNRGGNYQDPYANQGGQGDRRRDLTGFENRQSQYVDRGRGGTGRHHGSGRDAYEPRHLHSQGAEYYQVTERGRTRGGFNNQGRGGGNQRMPPQQYRPSTGLDPAGRGVWASRPWVHRASTSPSSSNAAAQNVSTPQSETQRAPGSSSSDTDPLKLDIMSLHVSEQKRSASSSIELQNKLVPIRRPEEGTLATKRVRLLANHFEIKYDPTITIIHYDVDVKQVTCQGNQPLRRSIHKSDMRLIREKLCSDDPERFPLDMTAYDGEKNIFSAVQLPVGQFRVDLHDSEDGGARTYLFTIKEVNHLKLSKLDDFINRNLSSIPRDILQGMDLVLKENPHKTRIPVGRSFYSKNYEEKDDLRCGIAAYKGFQHSLKPTSQGLALCLDYSVLAFHKPISVIKFLMENVRGFRGVDDVVGLKLKVIRALQGLKVRVTHRITKQKYTIAGLTDRITSDLDFDLVDPQGQVPPTKITVVDYFKKNYDRDILYQHIPCLELGKTNKKNWIPMEFCILAEGQVYPKENLDEATGRLLKDRSLVSPVERKNTISEMVQSEDGPFGNVTKNFGIGVNENMTVVEGRVVAAPALKLANRYGKPYQITVHSVRCDWNLVDKCLAEGKSVRRWALIDFNFKQASKFKLDAKEFINELCRRSKNLRMPMEDPMFCLEANIDALSSVQATRNLLHRVANDPQVKQKGPLQLIFCLMPYKHPGYKCLKWVSETEIGVLTQCFLSGSYLQSRRKNGLDQYLANLCLKVNAKLGGSNVELGERFPHFAENDFVMFIGADVNHPATRNTTCPSIAAVVGTVNWPAANRYAARIQPQECRKETIVNFGTMCHDLLRTFEQLNKVKPNRIVVFRDGVSEGQFEMVLNEELFNLKQAICNDNYRPTITLVVAQKRHHTRLFCESAFKNLPAGTSANPPNGTSVNPPPGIVVDTTITHPKEFDFYLCSHLGSMGTSKPTHYHVLWDENSFTSDELQKLIYHLCFTYARCTKPVSLVPPIYYADLVAYRGRMFQEVVKDLQSPAPSLSTSSARSSFASSSTSSTPTVSFQWHLLHPDLQNVMFFV